VERQNVNLKNENDILTSKLNNLETVFIGSNIIRNKDGTITNDMGENYSISAVMLENAELKKKIDLLELDKGELKDIISKRDNPGRKALQEENEFNEIKEVIFI
jgi:hypothetical protein